MSRVLCLAAASHLVLTSFASAQACPPLTGRHVRVADGVSIHIREWGGTGPALIFLSGIGASALAFDAFAPLFTDRFRVIGITKRGLPPSDTTGTDYTAARLRADVIDVMDSLTIRRAHVAGWSYGGDEAVRLAITKPDRVLSVVLLDSYDNSKEAATFKELAGLKSPPIHETAEDSASVLAQMWLTRRLGFRPLPITDICATNRFAADGKYLGAALPARIRGAIIAGAEPLEYSRIKVPVLAFFNKLRSVQDMYPDYPIMSADDRALANAQFSPTARAYDAAAARVRRELPNATVLSIPGAAHHLFVTDPEIVLREMLKFYDGIATSKRTTVAH